jgi:hypothetical protein
LIDADVPTGVEFRRWITEKICTCDALVALISDNTDVWQESEIKVALGAKKQIFLISSGNLSSETMNLVSNYKSSNIHSFLGKNKDSAKIDVKNLAKQIESLMRAGAKSKPQ